MRFLIGCLCFILLLWGSVLLVEITIPLLSFKPNVGFLASKRWIYHIDWWRVSFYIHILSSPIVIFTGLFQFNKWMIFKTPKMHRFLGMCYIIVLLLIAAPSGFLIGLYANGSYPTQISFTLLSLLWWFTTYKAYVEVRKHKFESHAKWMIRSYALTTSAISLRFYTVLISYFRIPLDIETAYILVAYASWIINLVIGEIVILTKFHVRLLSTNVEPS